MHLADYRAWMLVNGIDKLSQNDMDSPYGDMIEFRAVRGDDMAIYYLRHDELVDARYPPVIPIILSRLVRTLDLLRT